MKCGPTSFDKRNAFRVLNSSHGELTKQIKRVNLMLQCIRTICTAIQHYGPEKGQKGHRANLTQTLLNYWNVLWAYMITPSREYSVVVKLYLSITNSRPGHVWILTSQYGIIMQTKDLSLKSQNA